MSGRNYTLGMKLWHHNFVWVLFIVLLILAVGVWLLIFGVDRTDLLLPIVASVWGFAYFLHHQHINNARFFKELVTEFNNRYDTMHPVLMKILNSKDELSDEHEQILITYFNLCAEEYLFSKMGYIYEEVWIAWYNGMKQFGKDPRIATLWSRENESDAYYGFLLPVGGE